jgi:antitoxin (DNA-binding transcriptional repressor) of toxin-antitoxin stability system
VDDDVLDLVLGKLDGVRSHAGYWMARCPAHDDQQASLSVSRGKDQPVVVNCHAGCATPDILAAIGLATADISKPRTSNGDGGEWTPHGPATAIYHYTDETGHLLYDVCRTLGKQFPGRRPDPAAKSGWRWNMAGTRRVLYQLPQVLAAVAAGQPVYITEGEKDVHAIEAAGRTATCNPGGAGNWRSEYADILTGATVVVIADRDEPGYKHAAQVAASLQGKARLVLTVEAAEGKDAADHLAAGHSLAEFRPVQATPPPADPAALLGDLHAFLGRFVAYPTADAHVAHTLWIAHTHFMDAWESTPRAAFLSPEPGSGKTRALEVSELLVPRPVEAINTTPAYLFRKVSDPGGAPTILYDEIDTLFGPKAKDNEEIRGMLNAGHRRGAMAGRCVVKGKVIETEELPAYCAVALAGLGDLPDTLLSRSVIIRMRRRAPGETVEPFRRRIHKEKGHALRDQLAVWAAAAMPAMNGSWPEMPDGIADRDADIWEALLAVADAAGGDWPTRARVAAVALVADSKAGSPSLGIRLLSDLRDIFGNEDAMSTEAIITALRELDEAPWNDLKGKPLNPRGLAHRLRQYGVKSVNVRIGESVPKGYRREDLHDPWSRYLPPVADRVADEDSQSATSATASATPDTTPLNPQVTYPPGYIGQTSGPATYKSATSATGEPAVCHVCGQPLDPKLAAHGDTTHPTCEPT